MTHRKPKPPTPKRTPRRSGAVLVLLTPEERETLRSAAAAQGLALGSWLRSVALREAKR